MEKYIGFEYKEITVSRAFASFYINSYPNFGWALESATKPIGGVKSVTMKFKRDQKIRNKAELTRLQRQFETQIAEIESMERSKILTASAVAYIVGVIGTVFMAGSVFAITPDTPNVFLRVILTILAFVGWIMPCFLYFNISSKMTEKIAPFIENKYDDIYSICEKAHGLVI